MVIGAGIAFLWGLAGINATYSDPSARVIGPIWGDVSLVVAALCGFAEIGLFMKVTWGRRMAWLASVAMIITCAGIITAIPAIIGLSITRNKWQS